jgi:stage II sporulation protein D
MKQSAAAAIALIILIFAAAWIGVPAVKHLASETGYTVPEPGKADSAVTVRALIDGTVQNMTMDEYLQGVLRAEMPASFEPEALKAQAVAARTETYYKIENGPSANHPDADICDDINCCQAWLSADSAAANWGKNAKKNAAKIATAVRETDGMTILYDSKPIFAAFFSSAPGKTQNSGDVWVSQLPYLRSVASPENDSEVPNYYSVDTVSADDFKKALLAEYPDAKLEGGISGWITNVRTADTGLVLTLDAGGVTVSGGKIRTLFGLRSACFTVSAEDGNIVFHVTGYGHGVGMSQYGAEVMAKQGKDYRQILTWYYTDVKIANYTPKK